MTLHINACSSCARWHRNTGSNTCDAFPTEDAEGIGIPEDILFGKPEGADGWVMDPHVEAQTGDHGLQWTPDPVFATADQKRYNHPFLWMVPGTDLYDALQRARRTA